MFNFNTGRQDTGRMVIVDMLQLLRLALVLYMTCRDHDGPPETRNAVIPVTVSFATTSMNLTMTTNI